MAVHKHVLPNGVRVLVEPIEQLASVSVGLWCHTGSVHENEDEAGITHLIEHMLFKGTERRTSAQIAQDIEGRGGMINAFTDKEKTCYYVRSLADDLPVAVDVLTDMALHSKFDPEELEKEKQVILEEIRRSEDEPDDMVHERHIEGIWPNHAYGLPVIGTSEAVLSHTRDKIQKYLDRRYRGGNVILAVAGKCTPESVVELAQGVLGNLPSGGDQPVMVELEFQPGEEIISRPVEQVHFCIGAPGRSYDSADLPVLWVLDAILGGGMGSRLFQAVREQRGLAYAVGTYSMTYKPGGGMTIYGGTGAQTWPEARTVIRDELDRIMNETVPSEELSRVQRQMSAQMVLGLESPSPRMQRMARNELIYGREVPVEEVVAKINAVTASQIQNMAQDMFAADKMRTTAIVPA
jgi:predicted Zn-dependent peptidase